AMLLSHGLVRTWDERWPVSVSEPAIRSLRKSLPEALLITDDLQMMGLQAICTTQVASRRALTAGVDLLCIGNNLMDQQSESFPAAEALRRELATDPVLGARLAESRVRIERRKGLVASAYTAWRRRRLPSTPNTSSMLRRDTPAMRSTTPPGHLPPNPLSYTET